MGLQPGCRPPSQNLELAIPRPAVESYAVAGARQTRLEDLGVLVAALHRTEPAVIEHWVREQPTGIFSRRTWFLYETFTGRRLDLEDARTGNYVALLDPEHHVVAEHRNSRRHRVADNLLGGPGICPTVRLTPKLRDSMNSGLDEEARALDAWAVLTRRVTHKRIDPVVAAAVSAFAFVFIHPFADGNGRIHRFLVHHVLAKCGYGPPGGILPVSAGPEGS